LRNSIVFKTNNLDIFKQVLIISVYVEDIIYIFHKTVQFKI